MAYEQSYFDKMIVMKNKSESELSPLKNVPQYFSDKYYKEKLIGNRDPKVHQSYKGGYKDFLENSKFKKDTRQSLLDEQQSRELSQKVNFSDNKFENENLYQYNNNNYYDIQNDYIPYNKYHQPNSLRNVSSEENFKRIWAENISKVNKVKI